MLQDVCAKLLSKFPQRFILSALLILGVWKCDKTRSLLSIDLWKSVPQNLKDLNVYTFSKNIKNFLLSKQYSKKPIS